MCLRSRAGEAVDAPTPLHFAVVISSELAIDHTVDLVGPEAHFHDYAAELMPCTLPVSVK